MTLMFSHPADPNPNDTNEQPTDAEVKVQTSVIEEAEAEEKPSKVKIVASLLIVGVATYLAYWAQTPDISTPPPKVTADVFSAEGETSNTTPTTTTVVADDSQTATATTIAANNTQANTNSENELEVSISDFVFSPANITVSKGMTITWRNKDTVSHTVSSESFNSGTLEPGDSYSYTFNAVGTFEYNCTFHPQMKGTIVVEAAATPTEDTTFKPTADEQVTNTTPANNQSNTTESNTTQTNSAQNNSSLLTSETTNSVTLNPQELLADNTLLETTPPANTNENSLVENTNETKPAANENNPKTATPDKLATTGPEDWLYVAFGLGAIYVNRRKIMQLITNK